MSISILRRPKVLNATGFSHGTLYNRIKTDGFPRPVSLGGRTVGWVESEVQEWLQKQIEASRNSEVEK